MAKLPTDLFDFNLVATPNPEEFTIAITVASDEVNKNLRLQNGILEVGTPYKKLSWSPAFKRVEEFGDYGYTYATTGNATTTFFFAKKRSVEEKNTPFKTFWAKRQYPWPAVLYDLYLVDAKNFPQSTYNGTETVTAATYLQRRLYQPSISYNSEIRVEQFLSDTPWSRSDLSHPQPVPTEIDGSYLNIDINFPKCLHPEIRFPELVPDAQIVLGAGVVNPTRTRAPREQIFPATNFTDWQPFYIDDDVQPTNGLYLRERVRIYPPPARQEITI